MKKKYNVLVACLAAILFAAVFHRQALGLNLFVFETLLFGWFLISKEYRFKGIHPITSGVGLLSTALFTVLTHSLFAYVMNFIALFIFAGTLMYPEAKSYITSIALSFGNFLQAQVRFFQELTQTNVNGKRIGGFLWKSRIFTFPLLIIVFFIFIYGLANPVFQQLLNNVGTFLQERWMALFQDFDALVILTFLLGLCVCNLFFLRGSNPWLTETDRSSSDTLVRRRAQISKDFKFIALKNEFRAGVFLLIILNAVILLLNVIDIHWVWFNFDWQAQDLKQFVHEGTYLLILSILISVAVVLFFFRRNLNFYQNNRLLKYLSYAWIAQNGILTISVAIRNFYYIAHFSLAYKRIGVIIFLLLTVYGLFTVFWKVRRCKSAFYMLRSNAFAFYLVLVVSSFFNWDGIIAKYNFQHADKSFLHLDYLSTLSDKTLPELDKSLEELTLLDKVQDAEFPFAEDYMSPGDYHWIIENRKTKFIKQWEGKGILSWNLPEYLAYRKLKALD